MSRLIIVLLTLFSLSLTAMDEYQEESGDIKYVLALDPGNLYGYAQTLLLEAIEKVAGKPIGKLFDLIGGISTGSVIGSLLTLQDEKGHSKYTATQVKKLYETLGIELFSYSQDIKGQDYLDRFNFNIDESQFSEIQKENLRSRLNNLGVVVHDEKIFKKMLEQYLGHTKLTELSPPLVVIARFRKGTMEDFLTQAFNGDFDVSVQALKQSPPQTLDIELFVEYGLKIESLSGMSPIIFRTDLAKANDSQNIAVVDAVIASSSPHNLFLPHEFIYNESIITCIDGDCGHMSTVNETVKVAKELWPQAKLVVFSLGCDTGGLTVDEFYINKMKNDPNLEIHVLKPFLPNGGFKANASSINISEREKLLGMFECIYESASTFIESSAFKDATSSLNLK